MEGDQNLISGIEDRISRLPDDLLHRIMSFLTTLQAVRTCILSKRWKNIWTTLPYLDFKLSEFKRNTQSKRGGSERFKHFVSMTLLHRADINVLKFHLTLCSTSDENLRPPLIREWIHYVLERNPQEFHVVGMENTLVLQDEILTCSSLEELYMHAHIIRGIINLPILRRLHLKSILIKQDVLEKLLCGCPLLEELHLRGCTSIISNICCKSLKFLQIENDDPWFRGSISRTTINTPNLQSFKYKGCPDYIGNTMLLSMSSLYNGFIDLNLCGSFPDDMGICDQITYQLSNVQNHKLCCILLKDFFQRELPFFPSIEMLKSLSVDASGMKI